MLWHDSVALVVVAVAVAYLARSWGLWLKPAGGGGCGSGGCGSGCGAKVSSTAAPQVLTLGTGRLRQAADARLPWVELKAPREPDNAI